MTGKLRVFEAAMEAAKNNDGTVHEFGHGPIIEKFYDGIRVYECQRCGVRVRTASPEEFEEYDCDEMSEGERQMAVSHVIHGP